MTGPAAGSGLRPSDISEATYTPREVAEIFGVPVIAIGVWSLGGLFKASGDKSSNRFIRHRDVVALSERLTATDLRVFVRFER